MREQINQFPPALQRQLLFRCLISCLLLFLCLLVLLICRVVKLWLPILLCGAVFCALTIRLYQIARFQRYVIIEGQCLSMEASPVKKRVTALYLQTTSDFIKVSVQRLPHSIREGDTIRLYVANNTPVYQQDIWRVLCSFLALEVIPKKIIPEPIDGRKQSCYNADT